MFKASPTIAAPPQFAEESQALLAKLLAERSTKEARRTELKQVDRSRDAETRHAAAFDLVDVEDDLAALDAKIQDARAALARDQELEKRLRLRQAQERHAAAALEASRNAWRLASQLYVALADAVHLTDVAGRETRLLGGGPMGYTLPAGCIGAVNEYFFEHVNRGTREVVGSVLVQVPLLAPAPDLPITPHVPHGGLIDDVELAKHRALDAELERRLNQ